MAAKHSIPRRPWVLSQQYGNTFVLSQDNEIVLRSDVCKQIGEETLRMIIEAVNSAHEPVHKAE